ncbi:MAG: phage terminase large subunit [Magnetococcales bacterium]|nr:phage terminase large subunit [Magnetococcales bacterium]NGZ26377.1 phage terminase large subunit [Magnetococcales bacterium]
MPTSLTHKQFSDHLHQLGSHYRQLVEWRENGLDTHADQCHLRRESCNEDFKFFAKHYFPHYLGESTSKLHDWLFQRLPQVVLQPYQGKKGIKLAIAAPRGEAKSTLVTQIFTLWCTILLHKRYILIIMDTYAQATTMLEAIKSELENNQRLALDFPECCGKGPLWQEGMLICRHGVKIQALGSGMSLRGLRHRSSRPDLVICDDLENDETVRSRPLRDQLQDWLQKAVLKLGPPDDSMDVIMVGTILHPDSVLARLLANPFWQHARFQAILRWPDHMNLWEHWETILRHQGEEAADKFYKSNTKAMHEGAEVSWPQIRPLLTLMKIRARDGRDAFDAEMQNQPVRENATFSQFTFWRESNPHWIFYGAVDPSMGKSGNHGDPSAILVGGYDPTTGILDVVEADIQRRHPDEIIQSVIACQRRYQCMIWGVESVQFQEFFKDELVRRSALAGVPVPAKGIKPNQDKRLRILSLQPHLANGLIRLKQEHQELLRQLRHWGEGDEHDDGPDALQLLWKMAQEGHRPMQIQTTGPRSLTNEFGESPWIV